MSKKKPRYRQCVLKRKSTTTTTYLPEKFAHVGQFVKLKDNDVWVDGWEVTSAGELTDEPPDYRKAIRSHRQKTGDSLPKPEK